MKVKISMKKRNDLILIGVILVISLVSLLVFFLTRSNGKKAIIYYDGEVIKEVNLNKDQEFEVEGLISNVLISIKDGRIAIIESGCSNKICINTGYIEYSNENIVCLPNKISIVIEG